MNKPDLIICWIKHCDYPLFRKFLRQHRDFFGKIIIYWSEHFRDMYFDEFIQKDLEPLDIQFLPNIEYKYGEEDWRNIATNYMLQHSDSKWVCSVEQDFFTKDWDKLLSAIPEASKTYDLIGYKGYDTQQSYQGYLKGDYVHPSFWFIKRNLLEKTSKDFSAKPEIGCDHFGLITRDAMQMKIPIWYNQDHGFPEEIAFHQGGINQNYLEFGKEGFVPHRPVEFYIYNWWSMKADVPQDPKFMELCQKVHNVLKEKYPDIDVEDNPWVDFYKNI